MIATFFFTFELLSFSVLAKYSRAIRIASKELQFKQIQLLPPFFLMQKYVKSPAGETAMERILNSGAVFFAFILIFTVL